MSNASLLISILSELTETFQGHLEIPRGSGNSIEQLALDCAYNRGVSDVFRELRELCEKAQGHALVVPEGGEEQTEEDPEARLSADQYLLDHVQ